MPTLKFTKPHGDFLHSDIMLDEKRVGTIRLVTATGASRLCIYGAVWPVQRRVSKSSVASTNCKDFSNHQQAKEFAIKYLRGKYGRQENKTESA